MGFESLGVWRFKHAPTGVQRPKEHIGGYIYIGRKHSPPPQDLYLLHTHTHANTHCTLIRLKAFELHGDVIAQQ